MEEVRAIRNELDGAATPRSYRNKTYVIFDGDNDLWAYAYMKGWNESEHIEFDFYGADDLRPLTNRTAADDLAGAEKLINECGYHRRDEELAGAKHAILSS